MNQKITWITRRYNRNTGELTIDGKGVRVGVDGSLVGHYVVIERSEYLEEKVVDDEGGDENERRVGGIAEKVGKEKIREYNGPAIESLPAVFEMGGWFPSESRTTFSLVDDADEREGVLDRFRKDRGEPYIFVGAGMKKDEPVEEVDEEEED